MEEVIKPMVGKLSVKLSVCLVVLCQWVDPKIHLGSSIYPLDTPGPLTWWPAINDSSGRIHRFAQWVNELFLFSIKYIEYFIERNWHVKSVGLFQATCRYSRQQYASSLKSKIVDLYTLFQLCDILKHSDLSCVLGA